LNEIRKLNFALSICKLCAILCSGVQEGQEFVAGTEIRAWEGRADALPAGRKKEKTGVREERPWGAMR
jgi:hypothetical protein